MIPAIVGAVAALTVAVLSLIGQTTGPKHQRELMDKEISILERLDKSSIAAKNLSRVITQRSHEWLWATQEHGRMIRHWGRTTFIGFGVIYLATISNIGGPEYPALVRLANFLFIAGAGISVVGLVGFSWRATEDSRDRRAADKARKAALERPQAQG